MAAKRRFGPYHRILVRSGGRRRRPRRSPRSGAAAADHSSFAANRIRKKNSGRGGARLRLARA
jgi:hypothetical protein